MSTACDMSDISDLSSELSSLPSSPIIPPSFYPSPPPSQDSLTSTFHTDLASTSVHQEQTTTKRKRKVEPKPRTTRHLDLTLSAGDCHVDQSAELDLMLKTVQTKQKIVVVAGAGISVSAGIPDFRSSHGLFSTLRKGHKLKTSGKQLFDISVYQEESTTSSFHDMIRSLSTMASHANPTEFHHLLARLGKEGRLKRLYTQNVDELDAKLPDLETEVPLKKNVKGEWPRTIQLHGGLGTMVCQKCRATSELQADMFEGPCPPLCEKCENKDFDRTKDGLRSHGVGRLRPRIVLYNEQSPDEEAIGSVVTADLRTRPDALIVVGTSMKIPGVRRIVKEMCRVVRGRKDGVTMWINSDSMPAGKEFENCWDLVIKGDSDDVARHAERKRRDEGDGSSDRIRAITTPELEQYKKIPISVEVPTPTKEARNDAGILTPPVSHDETSSMADETAPIQMNSLTNPASKGRQISQVLGNAVKKPTAKPKSAARKKTIQKEKRTTTDQTGKINQKFRVAKSNKCGNAKTSKSVVVKGHEAPQPMSTLSPGAARSNGPMQRDSRENSSSNTSSTSPWDTKRTISPPCRLPRGMEQMIERETENN